MDGKNNPFDDAWYEEKSWHKGYDRQNLHIRPAVETKLLESIDAAKAYIDDLAKDAKGFLVGALEQKDPTVRTTHLSLGTASDLLPHLKKGDKPVYDFDYVEVADGGDTDREVRNYLGKFLIAEYLTNWEEGPNASRHYFVADIFGNLCHATEEQYATAMAHARKASIDLQRNKFTASYKEMLESSLQFQLKQVVDENE